jgi:predicted nucleic acid-binding Zn ribbon protein
MPTYVYKFVDTGETIEVQQSFTDETLTEAEHPTSGEIKPVKKVFQPVGVTFKGSGFFKTDNRGKKSATKAGASSATGDAASGSSDASAKDSSSSTAESSGASSSTSSSDSSSGSSSKDSSGSKASSNAGSSSSSSSD